MGFAGLGRPAHDRQEHIIKRRPQRRDVFDCDLGIVEEPYGGGKRLRAGMDLEGHPACAEVRLDRCDRESQDRFRRSAQFPGVGQSCRLPATLRVDTWLTCGNGGGLWTRRLRVGVEIGRSRSTGARTIGAIAG